MAVDFFIDETRAKAEAARAGESEDGGSEFHFEF
jgi:hypothetical protein